MLDWLEHKLESRFLGEISITSDILRKLRKLSFLHLRKTKKNLRKTKKTLEKLTLENVTSEN